MPALSQVDGDVLTCADEEHLLARALPHDDDLRLELDRTQQPDEASWGVFTYLFSVVLGGQSIGKLSLRVGDTPAIRNHAGHLGLGIDPPFRGRGYAARSVRLVLPLARAHGLDPFWMTCSPGNLASMRAIEALGATYVDTMAFAGVEGLKRRYRLEFGSARP